MPATEGVSVGKAADAALDAVFAALPPAPVASVKKYPCARCGKKRVAAEMVLSTHTRNHYCGPLALDSCARRAKRAKR